MDRPAPTEYFPDSRFEQVATGLCHRPAMYLGAATFDAVCAYLQGFDSARDGGPLIGLHPWLVVRRNGGNNIGWPRLARESLQSDPADEKLPEEEQQIRALGRLLAEFFEYRRDNGLSKIFHNYARWLLRRSWYTGPLRQKSDKKSQSR